MRHSLWRRTATRSGALSALTLTAALFVASCGGGGVDEREQPLATQIGWLDKSSGTYEANFAVYFGCVNGGLGETIAFNLTGKWQTIERGVGELDVSFNQLTVTLSEIATGTGSTTGQRYLLKFNDVFTFHNVNGLDEGDQVFTYPVHQVLVSKGGDSNIEWKGLRHFTIASDGQVTVSFDNFERVCRD